METCCIAVDENVQERVETPEPVTLLGDTLHAVLLVLRLTTPEKPFTGIIVMLAVPAAPTFTLMFVGLPVTAKSWTLKMAVTE
jgi:hypothetical protein